MNESEILGNRVLNSIEMIKHKLKSPESMTLFNDLLIIQYIVPQLSKKTLRNLLKEVHLLEKEVEMQNLEEISLSKVNQVLAESEGDIDILQDFLQCSVDELTAQTAN